MFTLIGGAFGVMAVAVWMATLRQHGATGLSWALFPFARGLARAMGGDLEIDRGWTEGVRFRLVLPACTHPEGAPEDLEAAVTP